MELMAIFFFSFIFWLCGKFFDVVLLPLSLLVWVGRGFRGSPLYGLRWWKSRNGILPLHRALGFLVVVLVVGNLVGGRFFLF